MIVASNRMYSNHCSSTVPLLLFKNCLSFSLSLRVRTNHKQCIIYPHLMALTSQALDNQLHGINVTLRAVLDASLILRRQRAARRGKAKVKAFISNGLRTIKINR